VGSSGALRGVLDQVRIVARTDTTELIEGETGTSKEVIANAIHEYNNCRGRPFMKLNCAAIPLGLLESELFGHEKGAFTGDAVVQKLDRFEAANGGTPFLDEIGDIPLELWPGNVRELQNFLERAVILPSRLLLPPEAMTLAEAEREYMRHALEESNWVVGGKTGAAARLGVKRTTLVGKIRKSGLSRETAHRVI
jgi:transcriptional regulator with GAF, ATPase, and Fis domain